MEGRSLEAVSVASTWDTLWESKNKQKQTNKTATIGGLCELEWRVWAQHKVAETRALGRPGATLNHPVGRHLPKHWVSGSGRAVEGPQRGEGESSVLSTAQHVRAPQPALRAQSLVANQLLRLWSLESSLCLH